jgi:hypothetical protein
VKRFYLAALGTVNLEIAFWTMPPDYSNLVIGLIWIGFAVCWRWRHNPFSMR